MKKEKNTNLIFKKRTDKKKKKNKCNFLKINLQGNAYKNITTRVFMDYQ